MRVLVCGDRNWTNRERIAQELATLLIDGPVEVCEGEARGADRLARSACEELVIPCTPFPANWNKYGRAAGSIRNQQMLDEFQPELVIGFHDAIASSRGTKDMLNRAERAGLKVWLATSEQTERWRVVKERLAL